MSGHLSDSESVLMAELAQIGIDQPSLTTTDNEAQIGGLARTYEQKRLAGAAAARRLPARRVVNRVRVLPGAPNPDERIASSIAEIAAILAPSAAGRLRYSVNHGVVTVDGDLPDSGCLCRLTSAIWAIPGVRDVVNHLRAAELPRAAARPDQLERSIARVLGLPEGAVRVRIEGCMAILEGAVRSESQRWAAEDLLLWQAQVYDVVNRLRVTLAEDRRPRPKKTA